MADFSKSLMFLGIRYPVICRPSASQKLFSSLPTVNFLNILIYCSLNNTEFMAVLLMKTCQENSFVKMMGHRSVLNVVLPGSTKVTTSCIFKRRWGWQREPNILESCKHSSVERKVGWTSYVVSYVDSLKWVIRRTLFPVKVKGLSGQTLKVFHSVYNTLNVLI